MEDEKDAGRTNMFSWNNNAALRTNESGSTHDNSGFAFHPLLRCFRGALIRRKQWKAVFLRGVPSSSGMIDGVSYFGGYVIKISLEMTK